MGQTVCNVYAAPYQDGAPVRAQLRPQLMVPRPEGRVVTPGCQIGYMEHTGCHQSASSTMRPTRVVTPPPRGCHARGYMDRTACHQLLVF
jgi:hypothetical protein